MVSSELGNKFFLDFESKIREKPGGEVIVYLLTTVYWSTPENPEMAPTE